MLSANHRVRRARSLDFRMTPPGVSGRRNRISGTPCDIPRAGELSVHVSPFLGARQIRDPVATLPKTIAALPGGRTLLATTTGTPLSVGTTFSGEEAKRGAAGQFFLTASLLAGSSRSPEVS